MATSFSWSDKARRRSCHRRTDSHELDVFEAKRYFSTTTTTTENLGDHRSTTLSQKLGFATRDQLGHSRQNWRDVRRVSLDMPMIMRHAHTHTHQDTFVDTLNNPTKDKKTKHKNPSSPGGKLASFFTSLISQAVSKKKKQSKSNLVEEEISPSGWRRRRRSTTAPRPKRTSMSDIDSKSSVSGFRTPPPYMINTPIKPHKHSNNNNNNIITVAKVQNSGANLKMQGSKELKRFVEEDGAESDSSSDLFELKLNYIHCGGGLPVYESTHMDSIKVSS